MALVCRNGNYYVILTLGETTPSGYPKKKWIPAGRQPRKARAFHDELISKARRGEYVDYPKCTLGEFHEKWARDFVAVSLKPVTQSEYEGYFRRLWLPAFAGRQLTSIRPDEVQAHIALLVRAGKHKPKSIKNYLAALSSLFSTAVKWQYVRDNPAKHVAVPRQERKEVEFLTPEQLRRLVNAAKDNPLEHAVVAVAVGTGLRKAELRGWALDAADLHSETPAITVKRSVVGNSDLIQESTKTVAGHRVVPLPTYARDAVLSWLMVAPENNPNGLVFCRRDGRPLRAEWFNDTLKRLLKKAGLPQVTWHGATRHSYCATLAARGDVPPKTLQGLLGHEGISTTLDRYGHLLPTAKQDAAAKIQADIFEPETTA
jgi:integrase